MPTLIFFSIFCVIQSSKGVGQGSNGSQRLFSFRLVHRVRRTSTFFSSEGFPFAEDRKGEVVALALLFLVQPPTSADLLSNDGVLGAYVTCAGVAGC